MSIGERSRRRETTTPPRGYEVIRMEGRYFPVRLHLNDGEQPGASGFKRSDGSVVSYAKRASALLYLYQYLHQEGKSEQNGQRGY